ncbi:TB2/DP1 HVA22 family protein [Aspergillus parasiticus SU-1]|uniref:Protein YOP1 n=1 Tax=Aspergillus parasiticus (strain ATCC 56775 / NRRL 5862 / SRRC 143 / SU-1) TaxID=1403190 RepID=A0A0F0I400_ASPPU|nr:TB2/DP1 HVA22 family protein [Aspergillus parasiticus SU-1]
MFGIIADLLSSIITILFPIFASFKALRSANPSQLAPWLMYWVVLSAILMAESWTVWILGWLPFYSWIRLFFFSYLVLPQTQGAKILYQTYVDPFLAQHEREIEEFIGRSHERAKALGLQYFYQALDWVRENVFHLPAQQAATPPPATGPAAYAQSLLSRFNVPTAAGGNASTPAQGNDWLSAIGSAVASMTSTDKTPEARAEELSASGSFLPRDMAGMSHDEKAKYLSNQQDMLEVLRNALAKEQQNLHGRNDDLAYGSSLRKNRSDNSFDHIEPEDIRNQSTSSNWTSGVDFAVRAAEELARSRGSH